MRRMSPVRPTGSSDPAPAAPGARRRPLPLLLAGLLAGASAAALGLVALGLPVLVLWLGSPDLALPWPRMLEAVGTAWLAVQGLAVVVAEVPLTVLPVGLVVVTAGLAVLAGRWAARRSAVGSPGEALAVAGATAAGYAIVAAAVATATGAVPAGQAIAVTAAVTAVAAAAGALGASGQRSVLLARIPAPVRAGIAGGTCGALALVALAAALVAVAIVARSHEVGAIVTALAPDLAGFPALVALSLGYLPVLLGWAVAYLLGPGFTLGAGTSISPLGADPVAAIPAFPLFAVIPDSAPAVVAALPASVIVVGALMGLVLRRRGMVGWAGIAPALGSVGVAAALIAGLLALSRGSLGSGRLAEIGPALAPTVGVAAGLLALGVLVTVAPRGADDVDDIDDIDDIDDAWREGR